MSGSYGLNAIENNEKVIHSLDESTIKRFSERLKIAIGESSVRAFARKSKLSESVVRGYLSGSTYPTLSKLPQLAAAAGCSVEWLAVGIDENQVQESVSFEALDINSLEKSINLVDRLATKLKLDIPVEKKVRIIALLYKYSVEDGGELNERLCEDILHIVAK